MFYSDNDETTLASFILLCTLISCNNGYKTIIRIVPIPPRFCSRSSLLPHFPSSYPPPSPPFYLNLLVLLVPLILPSLLLFIIPSLPPLLLLILISNFLSFTTFFSSSSPYFLTVSTSSLFLYLLFLTLLFPSPFSSSFCVL
jgi:hypothetical protein